MDFSKFITTSIWKRTNKSKQSRSFWSDFLTDNRSYRYSFSFRLGRRISISLFIDWSLSFVFAWIRSWCRVRIAWYFCFDTRKWVYLLHHSLLVQRHNKISFTWLIWCWWRGAKRTRKREKLEMIEGASKSNVRREAHSFLFVLTFHNKVRPQEAKRRSLRP